MTAPAPEQREIDPIEAAAIALSEGDAESFAQLAPHLREMYLKHARASVRAFLAALPGWRLVPTEGLSERHVTFDAEPAPPGLEDSGHDPHERRSALMRELGDLPDD